MFEPPLPIQEREVFYMDKEVMRWTKIQIIEMIISSENEEVIKRIYYLLHTSFINHSENGYPPKKGKKTNE